MDNDFKIPWGELLWRGRAVKGGRWVTGQLLRKLDDYYICTLAYAYPEYKDDEKFAPMIGRWHKVIPFTLERVGVEVVEMTDEEEKEYVRKLKEQPYVEEPIPDDIKDYVVDELEFDGCFTI